MGIAIHQIHPVFVGEVSGIDITSPISRDEVAAIDAGMDRYAVLVFRDQKLTDEQQMAFSRQLGHWRTLGAATSRSRRTGVSRSA